MAADYVTRSLSPLDYPGAWPTDWRSYRVVSGCNRLWALDMSHGWCLRVIIRSVTGVTPPDVVIAL